MCDINAARPPFGAPRRCPSISTNCHRSGTLCMLIKTAVQRAILNRLGKPVARLTP